MSRQTPTAAAAASVAAAAAAAAPASAAAAAPAPAEAPQPRRTTPKETTAASTTARGPDAHAPLAPVPDIDNRRFCRACQAVLPLEAFPAGKRRYLCRRHMWLRVKRPSKERARADPRKKLLSALWKRCWSDARTAFGHSHIALTQRDIAAVLSKLDSWQGGGSEAGAVALLPVNPAQLLSRANHIVVGNGARRELLREYRRAGPEKYAEALRRLD